MAIRISGNVVIPDVVGCNTTSGNTVLGINNLASLTTGTNNVAVGLCNLHTNTEGANNIALGSCSLHGLTTGSCNLALGRQAGSALTTGSNNTIIGNLAGSSSLSSTVLIGAGSTERIKVDGTGLYINGTVFTGGGGGTGPKITQVQITDSSYNVLDDTAIDTAGGYIKITGTDFVTGASVIVGSTPASSVSYVSSTVLNCQIPALAAGTYIVYVVNPDGGTAIRVNGLTASGTPQWTTGSTLPDQPVDAAISIQLSASPVSTYSLQAGSNLPPVPSK